LLEPLKSLFLVDLDTAELDRYKSASEWGLVLKTLGQCYLKDSNSQRVLSTYLHQSSYKTAKLDRLQGVAILGTLCLIVAGIPPLSSDKVNWNRDIVLACLGDGGATRHVHVIPATKDAVSLIFLFILGEQAAAAIPTRDYKAL
jgi:hypothetical protein